MVTAEDAPNTLEFAHNYIIYPQITYNERQLRDPSGKAVEDGFIYSSGSNKEWLTVEQIRTLLQTVEEH